MEASPHNEGQLSPETGFSSHKMDLPPEGPFYHPANLWQYQIPFYSGTKGSQDQNPTTSLISSSITLLRPQFRPHTSLFSFQRAKHTRTSGHLFFHPFFWNTFLPHISIALSFPSLRSQSRSFQISVSKYHYLPCHPLPLTLSWLFFLSTYQKGSIIYVFPYLLSVSLYYDVRSVTAGTLFWLFGWFFFFTSLVLQDLELCLADSQCPRNIF